MNELTQPTPAAGEERNRTLANRGRQAAVLAFCCLLASGEAVWGGTLERGATWHQATFDEPNALGGWNGKASLERIDANSHSVAITANSERGSVLTRALDPDQVRGCVIRCSVKVRAEHVSAKPNSWNGVKCMLVIETPAGKEYPQAALDTGTFGWREARFTTRIPTAATNVSLVLGLEQVSGKVWFDDLKVVVTREPVVKPGPIPGPRFKGHALSRLRGTMISPSINEEGLRTLGGEWNANLIRWQFIRTGRDARDNSAAAYDEWIRGELRKLDAALPLCEKLGIYVVVDLHSPPGGQQTAGGYAGSDGGLFTDKTCQDHFVALWEAIAARYKSSKPIWGYDLANEPVEGDVADDCGTWQELAERTARAIRAIDPVRAIIVEPADWGGPGGLEHLVPLSVSNVVYSVHMYLPHAFTHQNVHGQTPEYVYPGEIQGKWWDKTGLEQALLPVVAFQQRYNVHMYIGEFSAIRWAPGGSAARYLRDLIDIFERHEWDWTYHAFREWQGWSVEHGEVRQDTKPATVPTPRQQLLREWFGKNQKPKW